MRILAIETSCDETGIAVLEASGGLQNPKFKILKSLVASQIKIHRPFGGVVPNLAKREHLKNLPILYGQILGVKSKKLKVASCDLITVTVGPGLEPALWTGINFAQSLRDTLMNADKNTDERRLIRGNPRSNQRKSAPILVGANHLEGHLYSFLLPQKTAPLKVKNKKSEIFPAVALIVSGGHTILLKMDSFAKWKRLGETRDDAAGESFDKVARLLELPYPGGPEIEKIARKGNPNAIPFPRPMLHDKNYDFSFSGLKTAVLYYVRDHTNADKADVAASFQQAVVDVLVAKTIRAAKQFGASAILLSGGVASNKLLRRNMKQETRNMGINFFVPDFKYNQDNAAMIAAGGYMTYLRKKHYKLAAKGDLDI
jgi:N6-L-threonylcarbamoyladenine synthase